jgi:dipeptidyl aminopeptidase/acylaminoacyl peptidase
MSISLTTRATACLMALALATGAAAAQTPPALPPAEHFFDNPSFGGAKLSPSGRLLAVRIGARGKRESLALFDMASNKAAQVAAYADIDIGRFEWISDKRLVFDTTNKQIGAGDVWEGPGLYAVDADGGNLRQLAMRHGNPFIVDGSQRHKRVLPANTLMLAQPGRQDGDSMYVAQPERGGGAVDLLLLDTRTGRTEEVRGPLAARSWFLDHQGEPRLVMTVEKDVMTMYVRDAGSKDWRKVLSFPAYSNGGMPFTPLAFGPDGVLYVRANAGKDMSALHTFDLATGKVSAQPLLVTPGYDFQGALVTSGGKLLGVRYHTDTEGTHWFDTKMQAVQAALDKLLPSTVNRISLPAHPETPWVLVEAYSDTQPRMTALYNTETGVINRAGITHPQIIPSQMGSQSLVRYKARDGLEIPALLTLPPGPRTTGLPLVVMVHGGPYVRGTRWGWKGDTQFLASRGYAVLEPEFRGSTGYGDKHFRAGWKQWGLAMQDDIADGAKWAIAEGLVDPKRICIAGGSYGGYATLMGLVNNPELFKCGINFVGVTDIQLMFSGPWWFQDDVSDSVKKYSMPVLIGDPEKDAAQFAQTSPIVQAARITQPVLLAYGGADRRVPILHGKRFRDAVGKTNKDVEWIEYESEGHGWALPKNRIDFWTRVEKFLDRNIGTP